MVAPTSEKVCLLPKRCSFAHKQKERSNGGVWGSGFGVKRGWDWGGEGGGHHINSCPRRLELFGPFAVGCASLTQRSRSCTMFSAGLRLCLCHSSVLRTGETSSDIIRRLCCGELTSAGASPLTDKAFNYVVFHMFFMPLY